MAKLDKSKKYGTVFRKPGVKYYQDGKHFDAKGNEVDLDNLVVEEPQDEAKAGNSTAGKSAPVEDKPEQEKPKTAPKPKTARKPRTVRKPKAAPKASA